jgi:hypothetical protein
MLTTCCVSATADSRNGTLSRFPALCPAAVSDGSAHLRSAHPTAGALPVQGGRCSSVRVWRSQRPHCGKRGAVQVHGVMSQRHAFVPHSYYRHVRHSVARL